MKSRLYLILLMFTALQADAQFPTVTYLNLPTGYRYCKFVHLHQFKNKLYFFIYDANHHPKLMATDGTQAGTTTIFDPIPGTTYEMDEVYSAIVTDSLLFFNTMQNVNNTNVYVYKLWVSDGTTAGTSLVKEMRASEFMDYKGKLYFTGNDPVNGYELWVSDGTTAGTYMLKDICPGFAGSSPTFVGKLDGKLVINAYNAGTSRELWISDGTAAGTQLLKDIWPGNNGSNPSKAALLGSKLYFSANDSANRTRIWYTDGTTAGTGLLKPDVYMPGFEPIYVYNSKMYFSAVDTAINALYVSDGTDTGTHLITHIGKYSYCSPPRNFCGYKNKIYFAADSGDTYNIEFWSTDGTAGGTRQDKDIYPGIGSSNPSFLITYKNYLYFKADKNSSNNNLFQSGGSTAGTIDIMYALIEDNMVVHNGSLYAPIDYAILKIDDTTGTTGISSVNATSFSLYPNPCDGNFTIELKDANYKEGSVTVYDIMGRLVYSKSQIPNSKFQITLHQPKGIYLVKLQVDDAVMTKRVVVE